MNRVNRYSSINDKAKSRQTRPGDIKDITTGRDTGKRRMNRGRKQKGKKCIASLLNLPASWTSSNLVHSWKSFSSMNEGKVIEHE